jgi:hypothetical protein
MNSPVDMYQPLKAQPGNTTPPQSKSMLETADGRKTRIEREKVFNTNNE